MAEPMDLAAIEREQRYLRCNDDDGAWAAAYVKILLAIVRQQRAALEMARTDLAWANHQAGVDRLDAALALTTEKETP